MSAFRQISWILLLVLTSSVCGCATVPVSASNPIPNLTKVAVAPFFNLSAERTVDGRRFAIAYYTELQKSPGFEVIPVGVVEQAIEENRLSMASPEDALELARILNCDAVVVGAVSEYDPYYPPKLGLQIQWYSPRKWMFAIPGDGPCDPADAPVPLGQMGPVLRAQSPDEPLPELPEIDELPTSADEAAARPGLLPRLEGGEVLSPRAHLVSEPGMAAPLPPPPAMFEPARGPRPTIEPLMTYTRLFDGADPKLIHLLKNYVHYRADRRSGDWEAHLHRSDDFIRFASYLMVLEMLSLHGGTVHTEYVFPFWK